MMNKDNETTHNKLVRDKIPEIIRADGQTPIMRVLSDVAFADAAREKLVEEATEVRDSRGLLDEYGDLLAVMKAASAADGFTWQQVEEAEAEKAAKRGGFDGKIFLERVIAEQE